MVEYNFIWMFSSMKKQSKLKSCQKQRVLILLLLENEKMQWAYERVSSVVISFRILHVEKCLLKNACIV